MPTQLKTVTGLVQEGPSTLRKRTARALGSYWEDKVSPNMKGSPGSPLLEEHLPSEQLPHGQQKLHRCCTAHSCPLLWRDYRQHPCADFLHLPELFSRPHPQLTENLYCRTEKQPLVTVIFTRTTTRAQVTSQENYVLWCKSVLFFTHH